MSWPASRQIEALYATVYRSVCLLAEQKEYVDLSGQNLSQDQLFELVCAMSHGGIVETLDLSRNANTGERWVGSQKGIEKLISAIAENRMPELRHLDLSYNNLGDALALKLVTTVSRLEDTTPSLQGLDLRHNEITHWKLLEIKAALSKYPTRLTHCNVLGNHGDWAKNEWLDLPAARTFSFCGIGDAPFPLSFPATYKLKPFDMMCLKADVSASEVVKRLDSLEFVGQDVDDATLEFICGELKTQTDFTRFSLNHTPVSAKGASAIATLIEKCQSLQTLDLRYTSLCGTTKTKNGDISGDYTLDGLTLIANALKSGFVQHLDLTGSVLYNNTVKGWFGSPVMGQGLDTLVEILVGPETSSYRSSTNDTAEADGASAQAPVPSLDLSGVRSLEAGSELQTDRSTAETPEDGEYATLNAVSGHPASPVSSGLRSLFLGDNLLQGLNALAIGRLGLHPTLEHISLYNNEFDDKTMKTIFQGLSKSQTLKTLYVGYNPIENTAEVIEQLSKLPKLEKLGLSGWPLATPAAMIALHAYLTSHGGQLTEIHLPATLRIITDVQQKASLQERTTLFQALGTCQGLTSIDLSDNALDDTDGALIASLVKKLPNLQTLKLNLNYLSVDTVVTLVRGRDPTVSDSSTSPRVNYTAPLEIEIQEIRFPRSSKMDLDSLQKLGKGGRVSLKMG